jgi:putative phosphoribosyl transferase
VPVAAKVAAALNAPLDLILVRKIGVPYRPELAMGAVVDGDEPLVVRNEDVIGLQASTIWTHIWRSSQDGSPLHSEWIDAK